MVADISLCDGGEGAGEKSSLLITVADITLALGDMTLALGDMTLVLGDMTLVLGDMTLALCDMTLALCDSLERLEQALENGLESSSLLELSKVRALLGKAVRVVDADV